MAAKNDLSWEDLMNEPENPSRRNFLQGRIPLGTVHQQNLVTDSLAKWVADPEQEAYLIRIGRRAMACQFQVFLNAGQHTRDTEVAIEALDVIDAMEEILTVYSDASEVSQLNQRAATMAVPISCELCQLLELSLELYTATAGAFDVTAGPLTEIWAFARRSGCIPTPETVTAALANVGSDHLDLDQKNGCVQFSQPGLAINFGGIGKGYALDCASERLVAAGIHDFLFHGGRSSVLARGDRASAEGGTHWSVGLIDPLHPERRLAEIFLGDRALSTSGSQSQSFHFQGRRYGHILDPRTGQPAESEVLSATVLDSSAARADALSTGLFVLGPQGAQDYCDRHPETAAILVLSGAGTGSFTIETFNLDEEDWQLAKDFESPRHR